MIVRRFLLLLLFALASSTAAADGSVMFDPEIRRLLDQRPFFANDLYQTYDFATQSSASRLGVEAGSRLAGARIGPYRIAVKHRNANHGFDRDLIINCATIFLNPQGKETDDLKQAVSIREEFLSIEIEPLPK